MAFPILPQLLRTYHGNNAVVRKNHPPLPSSWQPGTSQPSAVGRGRGFHRSSAFGQFAHRVMNRLLLLFLVVGTVLAAYAGFGFTIDKGLTNNTPTDPTDDLLDAARWTNLPETFAEQGVRGLGGGLEYSISAEFCARIIPSFIDHPSCGQLRQSVQQSFDLWAEGHPVLRFVEISDRVKPELPPLGVSDPWRGFGAEIDLFALSPEEYPNVSGFGAWTQFWYLFADPIGTRGLVLPGNTLTSVDLVFNSEACFHHDPNQASKGCNHFGSLLLAEIGHALGLDHPNEFNGRNFDSDSDPANSIPIDCQSPTQGLIISPLVDPQAVMNSGLGKPQHVQMQLTPDDLGGRNFLYPICPAEASTIRR